MWVGPGQGWTGVGQERAFLRRGVEDWDRPEVVKRNLAVQVEALYPELADLEARPESRLSRLLLKVSNQVLEPRQQQLVLVVDGLDEVEAEADGSNPLPSLLPYVLPPGVSVLCASRLAELSTLSIALGRGYQGASTTSSGL